MVTMTYGGMVFHAMETDYFPRLSGLTDSKSTLNSVVNRQIEMCLMAISPLLIAMTTLLPWLLPLLFSDEFLPVVNMMRGSILAMYMRAMTLPLEYIALARGNSRYYLIQEAVAALLFVVSVIVGYWLGGLTATGYALAVASLLELFFVTIFTSFIYDYRPSRRVIHGFCFHFGLALLTLTAVLTTEGWGYWLATLLLLCLSLPRTFILRLMKHRKKRL